MPKHLEVRARIATGAVAAGCVVALAFSSGGFFASEWGLVMLAFLLVLLAAAMLADRIEVGGSALVMLATLAALGVWQLASVLWSAGSGPPIAEAERTLLYLTAAAALLVCLTPASVPALLEGITAGATIVSLYALATRLAPGLLGGAYDPASGYQLAKPIGYWNALGLLLVFGLVLAAGIALRRNSVRAALAGAAAVPLATGLYFTFSRGSVAALAVALTVLLALDSDRLRAALLLVTFLTVPLVAVMLAGRSTSLTTAGATLQTAQREGHRLAWQLVVLALLAAAVQLVAAWVRPRLQVGRALRRGLAGAVVALVVLLGVAGLTRAGGPRAIVDRAREAFVEEPPATTQGLDRRLLSASGNGRAAYWRVAARMVGREPLLGAGAGSFGSTWVKERPVANEARDAHNLYLETLAELGPVGLALLLAVLAAPFASLRRVRCDPSAPAAAGVLVAFLLHAAVDWDWEIPLLVLVALACGVTLLVLDPRKRSVALTTGRRVALVGAVCAALGAALVVHVGNRAAGDALDALAADEPERAAVAARRAQAWMPWSSEGDQLLGEALAEDGRDEAAREVLRRAARRDPGEWSVWYDLATVSTATERVNALTRARELNPLSVEIEALAADNQTDP
ncbi:MAG: O-antigen ligase family protein [Thermoleophilia bacterium]|nr:O-antigen ligase family protein [Thermoleophilia bacterium]